MKAIWKDQIIAESDDTVVIDGNHYFPADSLQADYSRPSETKSICPWKGEACYYHIVVDGCENADAAWYYPKTKPEASEIESRVAFWRDVVVE
jgi:uncharacterized protein (DUF427 family)